MCMCFWLNKSFWMRFIKFPKTHALPGNLMNSLETLCRNARASLYCSRIFVPWMLLIFSIEFSQTHPRPRNVWSRLGTFCRIARASLCCSRMFVPLSLLIFYIDFPQTHPRPRNCMKQVGNVLSHCAGQSLLFKNMCSMDVVHLLHRIPPDTSTPQKPHEAGWERSVALHWPVFIVQEYVFQWFCESSPSHSPRHIHAPDM